MQANGQNILPGAAAPSSCQSVAPCQGRELDHILEDAKDSFQELRGYLQGFHSFIGMMHSCQEPDFEAPIQMTLANGDRVQYDLAMLPIPERYRTFQLMGSSSFDGARVAARRLGTFAAEMERALSQPFQAEA